MENKVSALIQEINNRLGGELFEFDVMEGGFVIKSNLDGKIIYKKCKHKVDLQELLTEMLTYLRGLSLKISHIIKHYKV